MGFSTRVGLLVREGFLSAFGMGQLVSLAASPTGREGESEAKRPPDPILRVFSDEDQAVAWLLGGP